MFGSQGAMDARRRKSRNTELRCATVDLFGQRAAGVRDDCAGGRLEKNAIFGRYLFRMPNEYSTGSIDDMRFDARSDRPDGLFL